MLRSLVGSEMCIRDSYNKQTLTDINKLRWQKRISKEHGHIYVCSIDLIGVLKTVMHHGYSGISRKTNLLSEETDLYISQETFLCSIPDTIP